ncbi:MAG TPA: RluA family pseudouridine synthase [Candidatus Saccharimonadales bacterium]|nr:RluA family pseudouridine synthase [Candidatus Saccharimonadales bacterium]
MKRHRVGVSEAGHRLDVVAMAWLGLSRNQASQLIKSHQITVDNQAVKAGAMLKLNSLLRYHPTNNLKIVPSSSKLKVLYQDEAVMVVDKPAGLLVHPTSTQANDITVADLIRHDTTDKDELRPGIVHRLDRDTSGLIIIAKSQVGKTAMQAAFRKHLVKKEYLALVEGHLDKPVAEISLPIAADSGSRRKIHPAGKAAMTSYKVAKVYSNSTLVRAWPATGRTHQLRVHFAAIGHPIVGDKVYGHPNQSLARQFLHATKLEFRSPTNKWVEVSSPLPKELKDYLRTLG